VVVSVPYLNSELPEAAHRDSWDGAEVVGRDNRAHLGPANTGHALDGGGRGRRGEEGGGAVMMLVPETVQTHINTSEQDTPIST